MFLYSPDFLTMPETIELRDGDTWLLEEPFASVQPDGSRIIVPPSSLGTLPEMVICPVWETDYGSIPQIFQNIYRKDGRYAPAYVLHDWLYASEMFPRKDCDWILLDALQELGATWITRNSIYASVRAGGGFVWDRHDPKQVATLKEYHAQFMSQVPDRWPELLK
jgi:hypothetical protein